MRVELHYIPSYSRARNIFFCWETRRANKFGLKPLNRKRYKLNSANTFLIIPDIDTTRHVSAVNRSTRRQTPCARMNKRGPWESNIGNGGGVSLPVEIARYFLLFF
eukprot:GEMP01105163.1.p1 GENE.GEMP01105163.1~~GEMP01105163.1.p1  ORF type:complete len:106 (-),score=2.11 GEMP01105163.1:7-324(-)